MVQEEKGKEAIPMESRENFSRKRMAILGVLQSTTVHPTADWVYAQLKPRCPDLSLGTVYRNLKLFCENGKAVSVGVIDGKEHFDGRVTPHAHMVCSRCGRILDMEFSPINAELLEGISKETGCRIEAANVTFTGLCPACAGEEGF